MFFLLIILPAIIWIVLRPIIKPKYQKISIGVTVVLLAIIPVIFHNIISHDVAQGFFWPVAGGFVIGESLFKFLDKIKSMHKNFTTPKNKKSSTPKNKN